MLACVTLHAMAWVKSAVSAPSIFFFQRTLQFFSTLTFSPPYLRFPLPLWKCTPNFVPAACVCWCIINNNKGGFLGKSQAMFTWAVGVCIGSNWMWMMNVAILKGLYRTKDKYRAIIAEGQNLGHTDEVPLWGGFTPRSKTQQPTAIPRRHTFTQFT